VTPNRRAIRPPDDDDDALVAAAAEEYLAGLRSGSGPSRQDLLARHPDLAPRLAACLEGLEFVHFSASEGAAPAPAGPDLLVAQPLSDFRLVRELGRGGMGVVYLARRVDGEFRRQVALKVLNPSHHGDKDAMHRFVREGKATVLMALAARRACGADLKLLQATIGNADVTAKDVERLRLILDATGARRTVEQMIQHRREQALAVLDDAPFSPAAVRLLRDLAQKATVRRA